MLVKINKKPIEVTEEVEESTFRPVYFCVSMTGYALVLWLMDYICFSFFFYHPFPFMRFVGEVLGWLF